MLILTVSSTVLCADSTGTAGQCWKHFCCCRAARQQCDGKAPGLSDIHNLSCQWLSQMTAISEMQKHGQHHLIINYSNVNVRLLLGNDRDHTADSDGQC